MKRWPYLASYLALLVITTGAGAYLATEAVDNDTLDSYQGRLHAIQDDLVDIKSHLLEYRKTHGRYPTNDEGLLALDNFESRFKVVLYKPKESPAPRGFVNEFGSDVWSGWRLPLHRQSHGRAPRNANELWPKRTERALYAPKKEHLRPIAAEIVITRSDHMFIALPSGLVSHWEMPFIYESRSNIQPDKFAASIVDGDDEERYSLRVDDGIYISSIPGQVFADRYDNEWREYSRPRLIAAGILMGLSLVLVILLFVAKMRIWGIIAVAVSGFLGIGFAKTEFGCYAMTYWPFFERDREMVDRQAALLEKYNAAGVINDATYAKARLALDPPASMPATGPASGPTTTAASQANEE